MRKCSDGVRMLNRSGSDSEEGWMDMMFGAVTLTVVKNSLAVDGVKLRIGIERILEQRC